MSTSLSRDIQLQLLHFLCVFAWADLRVGERERRYIRDLCGLLEMSDEDRARVDEWIESPPDEDNLSDPQEVPPRYRELFLDEISRLIAADGSLDIEEVEAMRMLRALLFPDAGPSEPTATDDASRGDTPR